MNTLDTKNKLDTKYIINLDLIKDVENGVMNFALSDVETSDFFVSIYNNGKLLFNKDYMVIIANNCLLWFSPFSHDIYFSS